VNNKRGHAPDKWLIV